jgi:hypothetical protein
VGYIVEPLIDTVMRETRIGRSELRRRQSC